MLPCSAPIECFLAVFCTVHGQLTYHPHTISWLSTPTCPKLCQFHASQTTINRWHHGMLTELKLSNAQIQVWERFRVRERTPFARASQSLKNRREEERSE